MGQPARLEKLSSITKLCSTAMTLRSRKNVRVARTDNLDERGDSPKYDAHIK